MKLLRCSVDARQETMSEAAERARSESAAALSRRPERAAPEERTARQGGSFERAARTLATGETGALYRAELPAPGAALLNFTL